MRLTSHKPSPRQWTFIGLGLAVCAVLLSFGVPEAGGCGGPVDEVASEQDATSVSRSIGKQRCDPYVYLDDGQFKLDGKPYALKGENFRVEIVAKEVPADAPRTSSPRIVVDGKTLDLFLTAYGSYQPDNNSWCRDDPSWNPDMRCCNNAADCARDLEADISRVAAVGSSTVRLLMDYQRFDASNKPRFNIGRMPWLWNDFQLDLTVPAQRDAVYSLIRQAVQRLGLKGVRSLLLLDAKAYFKDQPVQNAAFKAYLSGLAAALKDEPFLLGFDFYNEPSWASGAPKGTSFSIDKLQARDLVQGWVDAVRQGGGDARHLLTIGNAHLETSIFGWDPYVLPIDFNSYHIYPSPRKWSDSHEFWERDTYYASLGGCGVKCPYLGTYDGANCLVKEGPVGSSAVLESDGMYYKGRNDACPAGSLSGGRCKVATLEPGRDGAFTGSVPMFYVKPNGGTCPAGAPSDGANCLVGEAPLGAQAFLYQNYFYYKYLSPTQHCRPPAYDEGANCQFGRVPAGYSPFILSKPLFYVTATRCEGGRKPYVLGETDFAVHELDKTTGAITTQGSGTMVDQAEYLRGSAAQAVACGYQGYTWWQHGDVLWGSPGSDHDGLYADFRQVFPGQPVPQVGAVAMRAAGEVLRDEVDFFGPKLPCGKPTSFEVPTPRVSNSGYRYNGKVIDQHLKAVPFALIHGKFSGEIDFWVHADGRGNFSFSSPRLVNRVEASHFGYDPSRYHYPVPIMPVVVNLHKFEASELPAWNPPHENVSSCRAIAF